MQQIKEVYSRALRRAGEGNRAEALDDFVWLYNNPDRDNPSSEMFRRAYGFQAWALMAKSYPPAAEKIEMIIEQGIAHLAKNPDDKFATADLGALQQAVKTVEG